jgi:hypothetical protein
MLYKQLSEENFLLFAMHHYNNVQCHSLEEFDSDLKRFLYLKKLFSRYKSSGELKERLILNHIIVLYNLFNESATTMLFYKIDKEHWNILITFLIFLNRMPENVPEYSITTSDYALDEAVIESLRKI